VLYAAFDGMYGGRHLPQAWFAAWNLGEPWLIPSPAGSGMRPSPPGSGKDGTPWLRTHRANTRAFARTRCCAAWLGDRPPFGANRRQALCADANRVLLTPSCCRPTLGIVPLLPGSGNLDTPLERMQLAKATALLGGADFGETPPPQAAARNASEVSAVRLEVCATPVTILPTSKPRNSEMSLKRL
jgi:hypothetical protein